MVDRSRKFVSTSAIAGRLHCVSTAPDRKASASAAKAADRTARLIPVLALVVIASCGSVGPAGFVAHIAHQGRALDSGDGRVDGDGRTRSTFRPGALGLFLERANLGHQRLDIVVRQALGGFHLGLVPVFDPLLDRLGRLLIGERRLIGGVGKVLHLHFLADLRIALAIGAVAFLAGLIPVRRGVVGGQGGGACRKGKNCQIEFRSFHSFQRIIYSDSGHAGQPRPKHGPGTARVSSETTWPTLLVCAAPELSFASLFLASGCHRTD